MKAITIAAAAAMITAPVAGADAAGVKYAYLDMLNSVGLDYSQVGEDYITNLGVGVCQNLRKGITFRAILPTITQGGWSNRQAGLIVGAASQVICPDTWPALQQEMSG